MYGTYRITHFIDMYFLWIFKTKQLMKFISPGNFAISLPIFVILISCPKILVKLIPSLVVSVKWPTLLVEKTLAVFF